MERIFELLKFIFAFLLSIFVFNTSAQKATRYTISGFMRDSISNESLISATIYSKTNSTGTSSNQFGFYSLTLPKGEVELVFSYIGYLSKTFNFQLLRDTVINIDLAGWQNLSEVAISANRTSNIHESTQMSLINVPITQIKSLPAFLGEVDVFKALQLMPGIQSGREGSTGLHVRGGSPDQNLILLDGVPIYNASHLLGFISLFNGDAINNAEVYKGGFPARYGGRVSSVIDISMKEGNMKKFHGDGAIGILWSKLTLEGPIVKGRTSFIVSGRRTYFDLLLLPLLKKANTGSDDTKIDKAGYFFYDLTAKINHKISDKDRIYMSAYMGNDKFFTSFDIKSQYKDNGFNISGNDRLQTGFQWGNFMTTFRWNHIFTNRLFSNTTLSYTRYNDNYLNRNESKKTYSNPSQSVTTNDFNELQNHSGINDWIAKITFDYLPSPEHYVRFGAGTIYHTFNPGTVFISDTTGNISYGASKRYAFEYSAYVEDDILLTGRLKTNIGLHWSAYSVDGKFYNVLQPRISARYLITPIFSAKASYSRMAQYVHLLTGAMGFLKDFWVPTTEWLRPQLADQITLSFAQNFREKYEISLEGYYKALTNVSECIDNSSFFNIDDTWEQRLVQGTGRSYGMELFAYKKTGSFTGWVGYTLSWTDRLFEELNGGKRFPYKYDRRHDLNIAFMHSFDRYTYNFKKYNLKKYEFSAVWVFGSGYCITLPVGIVDVGHPILHGLGSNYTVQYFEYGERNGYRVAPYHRLDLSFSFIKNKKWGERRWVWSVYNAYCRKNPFHVNASMDKHGKFKLTQYNVFPIIPSLSYQFKF